MLKKIELIIDLDELADKCWACKTNPQKRDSVFCFSCFENYAVAVRLSALKELLRC